MYTLNRCTAWRFEIFPFINSAQRVYWLTERQQSLKACMKTLVATFVPSESARADQLADLIQELHILNHCTACRFGIGSFLSAANRD